MIGLKLEPRPLTAVGEAPIGIEDKGAVRRSIEEIGQRQILHIAS